MTLRPTSIYKVVHITLNLISTYALRMLRSSELWERYDYGINSVYADSQALFNVIICFESIVMVKMPPGIRDL